MGYIFHSFDEVFRISELVPGKSVRLIEEAYRKYMI